MNIVIASGKGGTGKTTVATNLAHVAAARGLPVAYLDCDVEEPNGHLFLHPHITSRRTITRPVVVVDTERCSVCGRCEAVCQFSAIVRIGKKLLTYPQLCHSCGTCVLACPRQALLETPEAVGAVEIGKAGSIHFAHGVLTVGQAKATGLIRAVKAAMATEELTIIDAPPGASCPVVETLRGADRVVLVCEPTPFGLHDLRLVLELVQRRGIPVAAVINRCDLGDDQLREFCREQVVPILAEIPEDQALARAYSEGVIASKQMPQYLALFDDLLSKLVGGHTPENTVGPCQFVGHDISEGG